MAIGRRAGFKIQCWQQRVGSIPTQGTYIIRNSFFSKKRLRIFSLVENRDDESVWGK